MANKASVALTYNKLVNDVKTDSQAANLSLTLDAALVRLDVTIASAAGETDYLPAGVSQVDFLMVISLDNDVLLRTVAAGTQYKVPGNGVFLVQKTSAGVDAILLTGNGATDAKVVVVVGEA